MKVVGWILMLLDSCLLLLVDVYFLLIVACGICNAM